MPPGTQCIPAWSTTWKLKGTAFPAKSFTRPPNQDRFYKLQVDSGGGGLGAGLPELKIGWTQQRLYFVARGQGPYTLAYGNASAAGEAAPLDPLLGSLDHQKDSLFHQTGPAGFPCGTRRPGKGSKKPIPPGLWKVYTLWTVLVLGVLLLGAMAWRIYRQMNAAGPDRG